MSVPSPQQEALLAGLRQGLKSVGFKKRGTVFHRSSADVVHLVALQSGAAGTIEASRVTVNLAIWCKRLAAPGTEPTVWESHWRCRLGDLMPSRTETWWSLSGRGAVDAAQKEMLAALGTYGLPALDRLPDLASLLALWRSGQSPGLPLADAERYLRIACAERANLFV